MKKLISAFIGITMLMGLFVSLSAQPAYAFNALKACDGSKNVICKEAKSAGDSKVNSLFKTLVNIFLFILGAISVIMIIFGGIRFAVSGGNSTSVTNAKNTILYAVIGLIVALFAYAIVNFVITSFK